MGNDFSCCGKHERKCDNRTHKFAPRRPPPVSAYVKPSDFTPTPSFPATFEGVSVIPRYWSVYENASVQEGLSQALLTWKGVLMEVGGPENQIQWEAPNVKALLSIFATADKDGDRNLQWASGEVRSFVRASFGARSLPAPPLCQNVWLMLYREEEIHGSVSFDFKRSIAFLVCVAENMHSLATGASIPVEIAPLVYVKFQSSRRAEGKSVESKDVPAEGESFERRTDHDDDEGCATLVSNFSVREPEPEQEQELENDGRSETSCRMNKKILCQRKPPGSTSSITDFLPGQKSHLAHMRTVYEDALLEKLQAMASHAEAEAGRVLEARALPEEATGSASASQGVTSQELASKQAGQKAEDERGTGLRKEQDLAIQALLARAEALRERELRSKSEAEEREAERRQKRRAADHVKLLLQQGAEKQLESEVKGREDECGLRKSDESAGEAMQKVEAIVQKVGTTEQMLSSSDAGERCEAAVEKASVAQAGMDELRQAKLALEAHLSELKKAAQAEGQTAEDAKELRRAFEDLKARALDFERQCVLAQASVAVKRATTSAAVARAATMDVTARTTEKSAGSAANSEKEAPKSRPKTSTRRLSRRGGA